MADTPRYYLGAQAIIERQRGNPALEPYAAAPIFMHESALYEFIARASKDLKEGVIREQLRLIAPNLVEADTDDLFAAARFRLEHRVSASDALGYVLARRHELRFLTTDKAFEGLDDVELVG